MGAREVLYIIRRYGRLTPKEIKEIYPKHLIMVFNSIKSYY